MLNHRSERSITYAEAINEALRQCLDKYPEVFQNQSENLNAAMDQIIKMFENNIFPAEHVRWDTHLDHIGHMYSPGCFRCHDGEHKTSTDQVITRDCSSCHTIVEQGPLSAVEKNI